jgi:molybdopterin-containing oxidoreductase family iron-sulfur binding subunit
LAGVRRRLDGVSGRRDWKSLVELAESPGVLEFLHREFPEQASVFEDAKGRREFLTLMGASLALAGLTGCTKQPPEKILPYVQQPEGLVLGRPLFYATAVAHDGFARGVLVESHEGRPTKIEGNPDHPQSLGATDALGQAHVLGLYDPDRSQTLKYYGQVRPWSAFRENLGAALVKQEAKQGSGIRFLSGTTTSPPSPPRCRRSSPGSQWPASIPTMRRAVTTRGRVRSWPLGRWSRPSLTWTEPL